MGHDSLERYRARAFALTFIAYTSFHMTRKVPSVTKGVLHPLSATGKSTYDEDTNPGWYPFNQDLVPEKVSSSGYIISGAEDANGVFPCTLLTDENLCQCYASETHMLTRISNGTIGCAADSQQIVEGDVGWYCPSGSRVCWILAVKGSKVISYFQESDGPIPAVTPASQAPDCIHWQRRKPDGTYVDDGKVKAKPDMVDGGILLGTLDSVFLGFYTIGLFFSGYLGDRLDLRLFLTVGMVGSSIAMLFMGLAYPLKIHGMGYFVVLNAFFGLFQSVGWPSVVAVMGSWFGHGSRGFVMGVWNAHASLGNILGSIITAAAIGTGMHHEDWPLGYTLPALLMLFSASLVYAFLIPHPEDVGLTLEDDVSDAESTLSYEYRAAHEQDLHQLVDETLQIEAANGGLDSDNHVPLLDANETSHEDPTGGYVKLPSLFSTFMRALKIPGLIPFSLSLLFSKMCAYSLLYWGPYYLGSLGFSSSKAGYLCTFFDIGGVFGGIVAGYLSDKLKARGLVAFGFQVVGVPIMALYYSVTTSVGEDVWPNIWLMILVGFFINAPYALITTAVATDLGSQVEQGGDGEQVLALVTGIIDGTGSFGAMLQGIVIGFISSSSWSSVWHFLMVAQALSAVMLLRLVASEASEVINRMRG